jgi:hypothetical protein
MPSLTEHGPLGPPPTLNNDDCKELDTIKAALQKHALAHGYAIKTDCSTPIKAAWVCSKSGNYDDRSKNLKDVPDKKRRKNTSTMKTGCKFRVSAARQRDMPWTVKIFNNHHNHEPVEASSALPQHRIAAMSEEEQSLVGSMHQNGHCPLQILSALQRLNPASHLIVKDVYNLLHSLRLDELAGLTPIEWLLKVIQGYMCFLVFLLTNYTEIRRDGLLSLNILQPSDQPA